MTLQVVGKEAGSQGTLEAKDVVTQFYDAYNSGDVDGVMAVMAEDCSYHDMIYSGTLSSHLPPTFRTLPSSAHDTLKF